MSSAALRRSFICLIYLIQTVLSSNGPACVTDASNDPGYGAEFGIPTNGLAYLCASLTPPLTALPSASNIPNGVQRLDLQANSIGGSLPGAYFTAFGGLLIIDLSDNFFIAIENGAFAGLTNLLYLYLSGNLFQNVVNGALSGLSNSALHVTLHGNTPTLKCLSTESGLSTMNASAELYFGTSNGFTASKINHPASCSAYLLAFYNSATDNVNACPICCPANTALLNNQCRCNAGFNGTITSANSAPFYAGTCVAVLCPVNSDGPSVPVSCSCNIGYVGTVTASMASPFYISTCTGAVCPANSNGTSRPDGCRCNAGFSGTVTTAPNTGCSVVVCPANTTGTSVAPGGCVCNAGFEGTVVPTTNAPFFTSTCKAVGCPSSSNGVSVVSGCFCNAGFSGSVKKSSVFPFYDSNCTAVLCPFESNGLSVPSTPGCVCNAGYNGTVRAITTSPFYTYTCDPVLCPPNSFGTTVSAIPTCTCNAGMQGAVVPTSIDPFFTTSCLPFVCPANSSASAYAQCVCSPGFSGSVTSLIGAPYYTSTCTSVACPVNSFGPGVPSGCNCKAGISGFVQKTSTAPFFNSSCTEVHCPANSSGLNVSSGCQCDAGFFGSVTPTFTSPFYSSTCLAVACPINSTGESVPVMCKCGAGFSGSVVSSKTSPFFNSTCKAVLCPSNSSGESVPTFCGCLAGFSGSVIPTLVNPFFSTSCAVVNCPDNSSGSNVLTGCQCNAGFKGAVLPTTTMPYSTLCAILNSSTCGTCQVCAPNNYITSPCNASMDNVCEPCSLCGPAEYLRQPCHNIYDSVCAKCSSCRDTIFPSYQTAACSANVNTQCNECRFCDIGVTFVKTPCTLFSQTTCQNCTTCLAGEFEASPCTLTKDAVCQPCLPCSQGFFADIHCGDRVNNDCKACTVCNLGVDFASTNCTTTSNTICSRCKVCDNEHFRKVPCSSHADAQCLPCLTCPLGSHVQSKCTATQDTICSATLLDNTTALKIKLSLEQKDQLGLLQIAVTKATTFISVASDTIADMFGNAISTIFPFSPMGVHVYNPKQLRYPYVVRFDLDLNEGIFNVTMSSFMSLNNISTCTSYTDCPINYSKFRLQNALKNAPNVIVLSESTLLLHTQYVFDSFSSGSFLVFKLSPDVLFSLKTESVIGISAATSVLSLDLGAFTDKYLNPSNISLMNATDFIPNTDPPLLFSFTSFSLLTGVAKIKMTTRVKVGSVNATAFTFSNSSTVTPYNSLTLNGSPNTTISTSSSPYDVVLTLSASQLNTMKYKRICLTNATCFVFMTELAFESTASNQNAATLSSVTVISFVKDNKKPQLLSFELFDANFGLLTLSFDEPLEISTFNLSKASLTNGPPLFSSAKVNLQKSGVLYNISFENTKFTVNIALEDANSFKSKVMCRERFLCGLKLEPLFILDVSGNSLVDVGTTVPQCSDENCFETNQLPKIYIEDTTAPKITSFDLNMNSSTLTLFFNEPVLLSSFFVSNHLVLQNDSTGGVTLLLLPEFALRINSGSESSQVVAIILSGTNIIYLKALPLFGKNATNTFLSITPGLVQDMSIIGTFNVLQTLQVNNYERDAINPSFTEFSVFDASSGLLVLSFSEPVNKDSIVSTDANFKSSFNGGLNYTLTKKFEYVIYSDNADKRVIQAKLNYNDLQSLRLLIGLAVSKNTTFFAMNSTFIADMATNPLTAIMQGLPVVTYIAPPKPSLLDYTVDMSASILLLTFDAVILSSSVKSNKVIFQNTETRSNDTLTYALDTSLVIPLSGFTIQINISVEDLNAIKLIRNLLVSQATTWITFTADLCTDTSLPAQFVIGIGAARAKEVTLYVDDTIAPFLVSFEFSLDPCFILLNFSEPIDLQTLDFSSLRLQLSSNISANVFLEKDAYSPMDADKYVRVTIKQISSDELKSLHPLGLTKTSSFVTLAESFIKDMHSNSLVAITYDNAMMASKTYGDTVPPALLSYSVQMHALDSGSADPLSSITLTFSEYVNISSYMFSGLRLKNASASTTELSLTVPDHLIHNYPFNPPVITIFLSLADTNNIKRKSKETFYTDNSNSFVTAAEGTFKDQAGNSLTSQTSLQVLSGDYLPDLASPQLRYMNFNMQSKSFSLHFDEIVDIDTVKPYFITFKSSASDESLYYILTDSLTTSANDDTTVHFALSATDANEIQLLYPLCGTNSTTFLSTIVDAVRDMYGNQLQAINTLNVSLYTYNLVGPNLTAFSINMWSQRLVLNFDKPINSTSVDPTRILFQSSSNSATSAATFAITGGRVSTPNTYDITIYLSNEDIKKIRLLPGLFDAIGSSYISAGSNFLTDQSGLPFQAIFANNARNASNFVRDGNRTSVIGFALNLNNNMLTLVFDAVVKPVSLNFSSVILIFQSFSTATNDYHLSSGVLQGTANSGNVTFILNQSDVNNLETLHVCIRAEACYITIGDSFILDAYDVGALGLYNGVNAMLVTQFTPKSTPPSIQNVKLNMNSDSVEVRSGLLSFTLSESIKKISVNVTEISIANTGVSVYTLTSPSSFVRASGVDDTLVEIVIGPYDMNRIKTFGDLATSNDTSKTIIQFKQSCLENLFGVKLVAVNKPLNSIVLDSTAPVLDDISIIYNEKIVITLTFSETINASSLSNASFFSLSDNGILNYQLKSFENATTGNSIFLQVVLSHSDVNNIKISYPLWSTLSTAYLSFISNALRDIQGNPIQAVDNKQVTSFLEPTTIKPILEKFSFDLNSGLLSLSFSETVKLSTFNFIGQLSFTSVLPYSVTPVGILFAPKSIITVSDSHIIMLIISDRDLHQIKLSIPQFPATGFAVDQNSILIEISSAIVQNMFGKNAQADSFVPCVSLISDTTPPLLTSFSLDMNLAILTATFNEPIRISTVQSGDFALMTLLVPLFQLTTNSYVIQTNNSISIEIMIGTNDLNNMKALYIGSNSSVFLFANAGLIADMSSNFLIYTNALEAVSIIAGTNIFTLDSTNPILTNFSVNLNENTMTLTFSETVLGKSFNISGLRLQGRNVSTISEGNVISRLSNSSLASGANGPIIVINLHILDLNLIKANNLAYTSRDNAFLELEALLITDVAGNFLSPVFPGFQASSFVKDMTKPKFLGFSFNMDTGRLRLSFDEIVKQSSLLRSLLMLVNTSTGGDALHRFQLNP